MDDPLVVVGMAEVLLFLATCGVLWGGREIGPTRRRAGIALFTLWVVVLVIGVTWGIMRKFSA